MAVRIAAAVPTGKQLIPFRFERCESNCQCADFYFTASRRFFYAGCDILSCSGCESQRQSCPQNRFALLWSEENRIAVQRRASRVRSSIFTRLAPVPSAMATRIRSERCAQKNFFRLDSSEPNRIVQFAEPFCAAKEFLLRFCGHFLTAIVTRIISAAGQERG